jgi:hypothetical protein
MPYLEIKHFMNKFHDAPHPFHLIATAIIPTKET